VKLLRTTLAGACAAAVLVTPLAANAVTSPSQGATGSAAAVAATHKTSIRFLDFDRVRAYGSDIHVRGQLYVPALNGAVQGAHVRLYRQRNGHSHWAYLETRRTSIGAYPKFRFTVPAHGNATYRVVFRGNSTYRRTHGDAGVDVYRTFDASLESGSGRFHGKIAPPYRHHTVYLDRRRCGGCSWHRADSGRTSAHSRFHFTTTAPRHHKYYWRVSTPPSVRFIRSYSAVFTTTLQ
jgi:hypothetical protein